MSLEKTDLYVYADWKGLDGPKLLGILSAQQAKGKKAFSFEYDKSWLKSEHVFLLDPNILLYSGPQYANDKNNFGIFLDSMPDTWGKTLMNRRELIRAKEQNEKVRKLYDIDYLLHVFDKSRMGAIRFKLHPENDFLANSEHGAIPPWSSVRDLQFAVDQFEKSEGNQQFYDDFKILFSPGSSLGGARPKANIQDVDNSLWIAKFPSKSDRTDKAAWEFLAYLLAQNAGIDMSPCRIEKISGKYHTFFTKKFDRDGENRVHFASAMTMTANNEDTLREKTASYLDIAEFISNHGAEVEKNLHQLWRRIVFNIAISNTDDHLRNHGFLLSSGGWILSPAYDLNPSIEKDGLSLNIDDQNNSLDFQLAMEAGVYFRLNKTQMNNILQEVLSSVKNWQKLAQKIGIPRSEQEIMASAFNI
jgi:serine/threonine-protein kinase HipA